MKNEVRYCPMCKQSETRDKCSYGPRVWDTLAMNEHVISEGRKRDNLANAVLGLSFATSALQSPAAFINSGKIEGPGMQLMSRMMKNRGEANRNLDSGRVSHPARNRKKKEKEEVKEELKNIDKKTLMMLMIKKLMDEKKRKNYLLNTGYIGEAKTPAWSRNEGKDLKKGGLNRKGIASYRREHPGSHLSMAVTTKPSKLKKGSKAWKRRHSFCSRMSNMPGPMKDEKGHPTRKALSLRKWNC
jgi:hypothetical protein